MLDLLERVHRKLSLLPKRSEPWPEALGRALEAVKRAVEEEAPGLLQGVELPPEEVLLGDAERLRRGQGPEGEGYAFWLHQALRLVPWQEAGEEGRCPACGGFPDVGFLDEEGRRFYVCAFCDETWRAPRVACPYCGEGRADRVVFYAEDPFRIYVCRTCGERFVVRDLRLKPALDLPALRARAAWYAVAEEEDVEV